MSVRARRFTGALVGAFGVVVAVANSRNGAFASHYTSTWVLFGGSSDVPDDFGRNVFGGTIALGLVFVAVGAAIALLRGRIAGLVGLALAVLGGVLVVLYRSSGNVFAAHPAAGAVLIAAGIALVASRSDSESARG
ncbi:MAG: hypothetical protein ABIV94_02280 [Acidimicrobiales bacterium]